MNKQRVNKITARFDDNEAIITMYRTNRKLAQISNVELGIDNHDGTKSSKTSYLLYCKDVVKDLLMNDGISGLYFDDKYDTEGEFPSKFDRNNFHDSAGRYSYNIVKKLIAGIDGSTDIIVIDSDNTTVVEETYKDGHIKYGSVDVNMDIIVNDNTTKITVPVNIRSGQLCKPKTVVGIDGEEMSLNMTNMRKILGVKKAGDSVQEMVDRYEDITADTPNAKLN